MLYVLSLAYIVLAAMPVDNSPTRHFAAAKLKRVIVQSAGGAIKVRGVQTREVSIEAQQTLGSTGCTLQTQIAADVLTVTVADIKQAPCQMQLDIPLPRHLDVELHSAAGNIFVSGTQGALVIELDKGNAVLGGKLRSLTAHVTSGSLSAQGLEGNADITLGAGNAQLWYAGTAPSTVSLEVDRGNVTIGTDAARIDTQLNLEAGQLQCLLPQDAQASLHVKGHIAHGNVIVRQGRHP